MFAQISDAAIAAVSVAAVLLLGAVVQAIISLRKARQEIAEKTALAEEKAAETEQLRKERDAVLEKTARNGVVEELEKALARCGARGDAMEAEIGELRGQITKLYGEMAELRRLIVVKEVRVEKQATQVEQLQTAVVMMKDAIPAVNLPEGTVVKIPESTMQQTPDKKPNKAGEP